MFCVCKHRGAFLLFALLIFSFPSFTQIRWDGGGNDGQWTTAANWAGDILPGATDEVLLDNSFVTGNYTVSLPAGMVVITVKTLVVQPSGGNIIEIIIPVTSMSAPAFITIGPGNGLTIGAGGIFRNASGITSGQSLQVADSLRVNNGGRYIHQTKGSHATSIAQILSRDAGTETGVVEFDVPGTTGYTISASNRVYGTLELSAYAAGATRTYSSSGAGDLLVRGDLRLNAGVNYTVNLGGNILVNENLFHTGQLFNISSGGDNSILKIKKHIFQSGIISETSTGFPVIELCGTEEQQVQMTGSIINSVCYRINNPGGVVLQSPVSLPWKLELLNGKLTTSAVHPLILQSGCVLQSDSLSNNSFIDGPLKKEGLMATDHFLFPVGKDIYMRWLSLKNATGNFTVEYFKTDPRSVSTSIGTGINHISRLEYWIVQPDESTPSSASMELSFIDPNSGGVTDLSGLRVAQLINNIWEDVGNTSVTGTAGSNGSVTGNTLSTFSGTNKYFTLASNLANANPLPVAIQAIATRVNNNNLIRWTYTGDNVEFFEVMHAKDNHEFRAIGKVYAIEGVKQYQFTHRSPGINYYKLYTMKNDGVFQTGPTLAVVNTDNSDWLMSVTGNDRITVTINSSRQKTEICTIFSASGALVQQFTAWLSPGANYVLVDVKKLPAGMYTIRSSTNAVLFSKL